MPLALRTDRIASIAILLLTLVATPPVLRADELPIRNSGFEERGTGTDAAGWIPLASSSSAVVRRDGTTGASGSASLLLTHTSPGSTTVESDEITMSIGKPYRLTARVRTHDVFSDPMARYPTAMPATLTMASFPFTNHATTLGATREWTTLEASFFATSSKDRIRLHLGYNGAASGSAWFDDVRLEEVDDITTMIPMETVRWHGPAFRYTDRGWIFVHIEGDPYPRGVQYGTLLAREIAAYLEKLAVVANEVNPEAGWSSMRTMADALMLRGFREEYLEEMQGIADGAAKAGAAFSGRPLDFLDIVTVNSAVDLGQLSEALGNTRHPLSGRTFRPDDAEETIPERLHKCSSFLANGPTTRDGRIVFGQIFMWRGYTGVHWDVVCDVQPAKGHRLVYQTFPGGIHSGSDFYLNDAGIMIGETTVLQSPFDATGTPQSSRIREAAQYASSVDDVVRIMTGHNNGLYTNDWLIGDTRRNEIAVLLLGTRNHKLWRSSAAEWPGGTTGFYWSVNNAKDPEVRKEYIPDPRNAPFDLVFGPVNRDLSFVEFYQRMKGSIDAPSAAKLLASSPINRPHACDGKVTTSEMVEELVFLAHYGKVTQREKFPEKNYRLMPDLPGALPHLSLGYTAFSPKVVTAMLAAARQKWVPAPDLPRVSVETAGTGDAPAFPRELLWSNTVYPASERENWFVSGSAGYWRILDGMPAQRDAAAEYLREQLGDLDCRLAYTVARERSLEPLKARRNYEGYAAYQIPRIRGIVALHQLRLELGNLLFSKVMNEVHRRFREKGMSTEQFLATVNEVTGHDASSIVLPWIGRSDIPEVQVEASARAAGDRWETAIRITQRGIPFRFRTTIALTGRSFAEWRVIGVSCADTTMRFTIDRRPDSVTFNVCNDVPSPRPAFLTLANFLDDYQHTRIVYGTGRQDEANHTLALRHQSVLADAFTETLSPLRKDSEITAAELDSCDLILLGGAPDNSLAGAMYYVSGLQAGNGMFRWNGRTYASPDDGVMMAVANPRNPSRAVYVVIANSALQLHHMTKRHQRLPSWALFKGEKVVEKGFHAVGKYTVGVRDEQ